MKPIDISEDLKREIISLYKSGVRNSDIASMAGCSCSFINKRLRLWGIAPKQIRERSAHDNRGNVVNVHKDWIISEYHNGASSKSIGASLGCSGGFICKKLREWGVRINPPAHSRKYKVNHRAFSKRTEMSSYFAGLIMSDGCIYRSKKETTQAVVSVTSKDMDALEKFFSFVETDRPIHKRGDGSNTASFTSDVMAHDLETIWGITERKSKTANIADPLILYNRHFWRGMIDGDGHVSDKTTRVHFCTGSADIAESYLEFLSAVNIPSKIYRAKDDVYNVCVNGKNAIKLCRVLYDTSSVSMNRKKRNATNMIKKGGDANEQPIKI